MEAFTSRKMKIPSHFIDLQRTMDIAPFAFFIFNFLNKAFSFALHVSIISVRIWTFKVMVKKNEKVERLLCDELRGNRETMHFLFKDMDLHKLNPLAEGNCKSWFGQIFWQNEFLFFFFFWVSQIQQGCLRYFITHLNLVYLNPKPYSKYCRINFQELYINFFFLETCF